MKHIFSADGKAALRRVIAHTPLLAFDFDGTLAPLVTNPQDAVMPLSVMRRISRLAALLPVAIITGRTVSDVSTRLGFEPRYVIGNHGAEGLEEQSRDLYRNVLDAPRALLALHQEQLREHGIQLEDKGLSIALHYRMARDRDEAAAWIRTLLAPIDAPLTLSFGKCVVNVTPAHAPDKGAALKRLVAMEGAAAAVFLGDDVNDESAFAVAERHWLTVRVGNPAMRSAAHYFLDDHAQVAVLLQDMIDLLSG
ncbi:MAG: trehalose-phosphatase [Gammaproteobacteria bacterium]|nr:trehalose-phosphatase [Gammaproteobacteria bacterium]